VAADAALATKRGLGRAADALKVRGIAPPSAASAACAGVGRGHSARIKAAADHPNVMIKGDFARNTARARVWAVFMSKA
jgi:hypothetical protein